MLGNKTSARKSVQRRQISRQLGSSSGSVPPDPCCTLFLEILALPKGIAALYVALADCHSSQLNFLRLPKVSIHLF